MGNVYKIDCGNGALVHIHDYKYEGAQVRLDLYGPYYNTTTLRTLAAKLTIAADKLEDGTLFGPKDILIVEGKRYKLIEE